MAPCPLNLKECKISFSQVKLASKVEFNFGWHTWKLHYQNCSIPRCQNGIYLSQINHGSLALDSALVRKISKRHFFQDIKNSFHGVTRMGLEPHQNFFQIFFSTNMVARGVQSFCILEGATDLLIEQ